MPEGRRSRTPRTDARMRKQGRPQREAGDLRFARSSTLRRTRSLLSGAKHSSGQRCQDPSAPLMHPGPPPDRRRPDPHSRESDVLQHFPKVEPAGIEPATSCLQSTRTLVRESPRYRALCLVGYQCWALPVYGTLRLFREGFGRRQVDAAFSEHSGSRTTSANACAAPYRFGGLYSGLSGTLLATSGSMVRFVERPPLPPVRNHPAGARR